MSNVRKYAYCQKWHQSSGSTAISLQRLWCLPRTGTQTSGEKKSKGRILKSYLERVSLRGLERIFEVSRQRISAWIKAHAQELPDLKDTLLPAEPGDVLEYDEAWSFVLKKANKRWLWTVMCRRTRQILAFVIGDRSKASCRQLWCKIPDAYRKCISYSDFWEAYQRVLPKETHFSVGKGSGQTSHMERWYGTLRQRQARFVRKTLSFSKSEVFHHLVTKWYIVEHNLAMKEFLSPLTL